MEAAHTTALEWHALYDDEGEGEPWMAYVHGHHDLFALAPIAESEIRKAFPAHETDIAEYLDEAGGAALAHFWLKDTGHEGDITIFNTAKPDEPGAFAVTGVRFYL